MQMWNWGRRYITRGCSWGTDVTWRPRWHWPQGNLGKYANSVFKTKIRTDAENESTAFHNVKPAVLVQQGLPHTVRVKILLSSENYFCFSMKQHRKYVMKFLAKVKKIHNLDRRDKKRIIGPPSRQVVLSWEWCCILGGIWPDLETFLVVTTAGLGEGATGTWWVEASNGAQHSTVPPQMSMCHHWALPVWTVADDLGGITNTAYLLFCSLFGGWRR